MSAKKAKLPECPVYKGAVTVCTPDLQNGQLRLTIVVKDSQGNDHTFTDKVVDKKAYKNLELIDTEIEECCRAVYAMECSPSIVGHEREYKPHGV